MFWFWLLLAVFGDFIYLFCARKFAGGGGTIWFFATILSLVAVGTAFTQTLQFRGLAIANILWAALSIVFGAVAGIFIFSEKITAVQFGGIFLVLVGIAFLELGAKS